MKVFANLMILTVAFAATATQAQAQQQSRLVQQPQVAPPAQGGQQCYVNPGFQPQPQPQNPYYFGVDVQLLRGYSGTTLRVVSVTYGSPAQRAGLEVGDEIRTVNGRGFAMATDSFDAVRLMNQFVSSPYAGGPAPAVAAAAVPGAQAAYVAPPQPAQPLAMMIVRNVRTGGDVQVPVYPTPRFVTQPGFGPAPAAAAAVEVSPQAGG